jgi:phosphatidate cytidylyltransferase
MAAVAVPSLWPVLAARPATALSDWSGVTLGVMYYGWLGSHAVLLRELPDGRDWLLLGLFGVFATDTGAYFVGRSLGRHHLAPEISPHKTWEGAAGGFAAGLVVVLTLRALFGLPLSERETLLLGLILPVVAQLGDLAKSALKRSAGVKDFGRIMPGHGGMADRIDSLLFAIPVLYFWLRWI